MPFITSGFPVKALNNGVLVSPISRGFDFEGNVTVTKDSHGINHVFIGGIPDLIATAQTVNDVPVSLFQFEPPQLKSGLLTFQAQGRKSGGEERCAFIRQVQFWKETGNAFLSSKIHFPFTDKTFSTYDVLLQAVGTKIILSVKGAQNHVVDWSGNLTYQLTP